MDRKYVFPFFGAGVAIVALIFFRARKAKAEEKGKEFPEVAIPVANAPIASAQPDPATGVSVLGPKGSIPTGGGLTQREVQRGESWSNIASRAYGDYRWWPAIWDMTYISRNQRGLDLKSIENPDVLAVGELIILPPAGSPLFANDEYKAVIFARAAAHRDWWLNKIKKGSRPRPFPASVLVHTDPTKYLQAAPAANPQGNS